MHKFKVKLKIEKFELEVEGSRDDIQLIAQNVSQQVAGMLAPAAGIVDGSGAIDVEATPDIAHQEEVNNKPKRKRRNGSARRIPTLPNDEIVFDWRHDPGRWGSPQQDWNTTKKAIWILYVVEHELSKTEMSGSQIAATFNKHFRQAGAVHPPNVTRDLGKAKQKAPAIVGEDTSISPSQWYLTDKGKSFAQELIAEALGQVSTEMGGNERGS